MKPAAGSVKVDTRQTDREISDAVSRLLTPLEVRVPELDAVPRANYMEGLGLLMDVNMQELAHPI